MRLLMLWAAFLFLIALTGYGFWSHPTLLAAAWTPSGEVRFLSFAAGYALAIGAAYFTVARHLPLILAVLSVVIVCGAVGMGAPAASALFFLSSMVLGRALLSRANASEQIAALDMIFAMLLGAVIYMTVVGWTAMFRVHYPVVHAVVLFTPLVVWPGLTRECLSSLAGLFKAREWESLWDYAGFAMAAFVPIAHLIDAVLLPQVNSDAVVLHLAVPSLIAINHDWSFDAHRFVFAVAPMGGSWMMLPAYLLGGEFAARLVNFSFFLIVATLVFLAARRFLSLGTAWLLTALFASTPLLLTETGNIFIENFLVTLLFAAALSAVRFHETAQEKYFLLLATFAASSLAVKVLGAVLIALLFVLVIRECLAKPIRFAWAFGLFAIFGAYPYLYAFIKTGNPLFPFMNQIFRSPYFAPVAFAGVHRPIPSGLYDLTFYTERYVDNGGTNGAFGFHWLVLLPIALLALKPRYPYLGLVSLASALVYIASVILLVEANLRYLYAAFPFAMVLIAVAFAQAKDLSKPLYISLCSFAVGAMFLNSYAMPTAAWAHREFSIAMAIGRVGVENYRDWGSPERKLIDYLNLTRGHAVRVVQFSRPTTVDLKGEAIFGNWYNYLFATQKLAKAKSAEDVFHLMREERITKFIAFRPESGNLNISPAVEAFLRKYTEPEFSVSDVYLARYKNEFRFSENVLKNGSFSQGLADWTGTDISIYNSSTHTISVTSERSLHQLVPIDDRLVYRYESIIRCAKPGSHARIWVNWYNSARRLIGTFIEQRRCEAEFETIAMELAPPQRARFADVIMAGNEPDKAIEVAKISLDW